MPCRECGEFSFSLHMFSSDFGRMPRAENAVSEVCREWRMSLSNKSFSRNAIFLIFVISFRDGGIGRVPFADIFITSIDDNTLEFQKAKAT